MSEFRLKKYELIRSNASDGLFFSWSAQNITGGLGWRWDRRKSHNANVPTACQVESAQYNLALNLTDRVPAIEYTGDLAFDATFRISPPDAPGDYVFAMYEYVPCNDTYTNEAIPAAVEFYPGGVYVPGGGNSREVIGFDLFDGVLPATSVGFDNDEVATYCPVPQWELDNICEDNDITDWSFNREECPEFVSQMRSTGYNCDTHLISLQIPGVPDTTLGEQCKVTCEVCDVNQKPRCLAVRAYVDVSVTWPPCSELPPLEANETVTCTGIADLVPVGCSGTASDGLTDCATYFGLQVGSAEADCNQNAGAGCNYDPEHTPTCADHDVCDDCPTATTRCPAGCIFRYCDDVTALDTQYPEPEPEPDVVPEPEPAPEPEPEPAMDPRDLYPWIVPLELEEYELHYAIFALTVPTKPLHEVRIDLVVDPASQVLLSPTYVVLRPDDWDLTRYITVRGLPDDLYEGEGYQAGSPGNGAGASGDVCRTGCGGLDASFDPLADSDYRNKGSNTEGRRMGAGYSSLSFFFPRLGDVEVTLKPSFASFDCFYDNVNGSAGATLTLKDSDCPDGFAGDGLIGCTDIDECLLNYTLADAAPGDLISVSNGACRSYCQNIPGTFACSACPATPGPTSDAPGVGIELYSVSPGIDNTSNSAIWSLTMNESESRSLSLQLESQPFHPVIVHTVYDLTQIYVAQYDPERSVRTSNLIHLPPDAVVFTGPIYPALERAWYPSYLARETYQIRGQEDEKYEGVYPLNESLSHNVSSYDCNYDGLSLPNILVSLIDVDPLFELKVYPPSGITIGEAEFHQQGRYFIKLTGQPEEDITIRVIVDGAAADQLIVPETLITIVAARYFEMQQVNVLAILDGVSENVSQTVYIRHEIVECAQPGDRGVCQHNHSMEIMPVVVEDDDYAVLNIVQPPWADRCEFCDPQGAGSAQAAAVRAERAEYDWLAPWPACQQMFLDMVCGAHCSPARVSYSNVPPGSASAQLTALLGQDAQSILNVNNTVDVCRHHADLMFAACGTSYFGMLPDGAGYVPGFEADHVYDMFNTTDQFFEGVVAWYNTSTLLIPTSSTPCYGSPELLEGRNTTYSGKCIII